MALPGAENLLEREVETADLQRAVDHSGHGVGRLVVIEGPAGIGKTSLVRAVHERARHAGMKVRVARGSELEQSFAFGVVRQLFDSLVAAADEGERTELFAGAAELAAPLFDAHALTHEHGHGDTIYPRLHGLYWMCSNLARRRPLALCIDDAQWADEPSLAFLGFLARRLDEQATLLVASARSPETGATGVLSELLGNPVARVLKPRELSANGVARMLAAPDGRSVDQQFAQACHDATAGNPFLLRELLRELDEAGIEPMAANMSRIASIGPQGLAGAVLMRLGRLSPAAPALACAIAILGDGAGIGAAAALSAVDERDANEAATAMLTSDLLAHDSGLTFAHPIIRTAIYHSLLPAERERRHAQAARLLYQAGAPAEQVAAQILLADQMNEPWALEQLRLAARSAVALGAPRNAVAYLERALSADHDQSEHSALLVQLGHAAALAGLSDAPAHLEAALAATSDADERARVAIMLAQVLKFTGRAPRAVEILSNVEAGTNRELADRVEIELLSTVLASRRAHELLAGRVRELRGDGAAPASELERFRLVVLAYERVLQNRPAAEILELIDRADPQLGPVDERIVARPGLVGGGAALIYCDELDRARAWFTGLIEHARRRGSLTALAIGLSLRAEIDYRRGDLHEAHAGATEALELSLVVSDATRFLLQYSMATINNLAVEQDRERGELTALLSQTDENLDVDARHVGVLLNSRARLLLALGRPEEALAQLLELGEHGGVPGTAAPSFIPWRSNAALIAHQLGDRATAERLAEEELTLAQAMGAPRAVGMALRAAALVQPSPSIELLERSVELLGHSPSRLEHARALIDLGATLRRAGARSAARAPLREGHDLAVLSAATRLAERARQEIAATGARVAPARLAGAASLTPSERRVAELAAQGQSNRAIAQTLFITEKTVETHLRHVYDKLDIRSRHKLEARLMEPDGQPV
ncbi:MAG TPA: AAA family ATPase [Solirubrobacteraceae bacterium]|nr:AAA family ATPase [Solirubrobacteraceae bacterium]